MAQKKIKGSLKFAVFFKMLISLHDFKILVRLIWNSEDMKVITAPIIKSFFMILVRHQIKQDTEPIQEMGIDV
jgi:hypothetical protein